jgi:hypothetical protein
LPAAGFSFGDFNAYDIGLYSEDSSTSSRSDATQDLLQPVPSLPGLSEPIAVQPGSQHAALKLIKQQKAAESTSTALSPTQHYAWRQGHAPKAGGEAGFALYAIHCALLLSQLQQHKQPIVSAMYMLLDTASVESKPISISQRKESASCSR